MEENAAQAYATHEIDPWRVLIALAPVVAVGAFACAIHVEAPAQHQGAVQVLRLASWVVTVIALAWFFVVAMMGRGPRTMVGPELRMFVERNSRMPCVANAYSAVSAAATFAVAFTLAR